MDKTRFNDENYVRYGFYVKKGGDLDKTLRQIKGQKRSETMRFAIRKELGLQPNSAI